jgi:hypothetical protein
MVTKTPQRTHIHTYPHTVCNSVLMSSLRTSTSYFVGGALVYVANTNPREKVWSQRNEHIRFRVRAYITWLQLISVPLLCCIVFLSFNMTQATLYVTLTHNQGSVSHALHLRCFFDDNCSNHLTMQRKPLVFLLNL